MPERAVPRVALGKWGRSSAIRLSNGIMKALGLVTAESGLPVPPRPGREETMNLYRRLGALFLMLALDGCAQAVTGQGQVPYALFA